MNWTEHGRYDESEGKDFIVTIEPRPLYCDRGNFVARLFQKPGAGHPLIDHQDGWPRYYFDLDRARAEVHAWFEKRGQLLEPNFDTGREERGEY